MLGPRWEFMPANVLQATQFRSQVRAKTGERMSVSESRSYTVKKNYMSSTVLEHN